MHLFVWNDSGSVAKQHELGIGSSLRSTAYFFALICDWTGHRIF